MDLFIQSLAILGLIIWGISYHFKNRKTILLVQLISFIFWITHFTLLGAQTGAVVASIAAIRLALFSFKKQNNWISKQYVLYFFIILLVIFTYLTYSSYYSLFALVGGILAIIASWQIDTQKIRAYFIPSHISWIIYDLFVGSYGGALAEAILGISSIISISQNKKKTK